MKKTRRHFNIVLRPEPEGEFTAIVPALPGCVTYSRTLPEARQMAKDAISGYIESLRKHGEHLNRRGNPGYLPRFGVCRNYPPLDPVKSSSF